jgi:hypothetical protein
MVVVHPSTWVLDTKQISSKYINFNNLFQNKIKSLEFFNGNPIFNIGLFVPTVITHIINEEQQNINVDYFGNKYQVVSTTDVTKFGPEWKNIVEPFLNKIKKYTETYGNILNHTIKIINKEKHHCQLAAIRGNVDKEKMIKDDFYTIITQNSNDCKGIRIKDIIKKGGTPPLTFEFITEMERDNFIEYCKTYFVRFCLCLLKNSQNTNRGECILIPWLDFTKKWTDKELYNYFNISKELQNYIENFLPDYYELRGKK